MRKKYILLILAAAMMCTAMTGCGNKVNSEANINDESTVSVDSSDSSQTDEPDVSELPNGDAVIPANDESTLPEQNDDITVSDDEVSSDEYSYGEPVIIDGTDEDGNLIEPIPDTTTSTLILDDPNWEHDESGFVVF